ncbi:MAG: hypothetical protein Q9187_004353 [Circinaria calcarea]
MSDSLSELEKEKPPATLPPSAYVPGRRASVEPSAAAKKLPPTTVEEGPILDELGLPLKISQPRVPRRGITGASDVGQGEERAEESITKIPSSGDRRSQAFRKSTEAESPVDATRASSSPPSPPPLRNSDHDASHLVRQSMDNQKDGNIVESPRLGRIPESGPVLPAGGVSEWSHQVLASNHVEVKEEKEDDEWQDMPAYGKYDHYDDEGHLVARAVHDSDQEGDAYDGIGGAGKGYTRVLVDDDAKSATSMDENTSYLFKDKGTNVVDEDEDQRDPLAQMQATKDLLTEGQRIAYVGVTRLAMVQMVEYLESIQVAKVVKKETSSPDKKEPVKKELSSSVKKEIASAIESMKKWSQKMMVRLYTHMEINSLEQVMIEQLAEHGVQPRDLTPALMQNSRVRNPMAMESSPSRSSVSSPNLNSNGRRPSRAPSVSAERISECPSPPAYEIHKDDDLPEVRNPTMLPPTRSIDIDLRWTVLCDLFLVLIADSIYDARSRVLLERVGAAMDIKWLDICRFEKRVTDALEMQEAAARENWDEADHMESRRKKALKRKYMMMGLATVGGSLVIGLSAGLLAPVIGAGLAAGFTTIGVAGTSGFLAGAGGTALITSGAVLSGGTIAVRASHRRTGAVKTFEYRPLHNNKRVNLIVTISGWMNGKIDDVRLPFSTIDPIMGDMYSVLWEPDMLQSMGDTIRILATEALTQGLQQVLASTILTALMASLTLPIVLTKLSYLIDNPWAVSMDRADAAGLILADSLMARNLGVRPITLVGFSLGSRVIFSCLRELANQGAHGLVQNVYLFGSPVVAKKEEYIRARAVVSGRFVNGYASNDWILGYLFRATSGGISRIAGLAPVEDVPGVENINFTEHVNGHMAYRAAMPRLLREVGWEVESEEFTEIEDPDPDNHEKRQRELIREIDEARHEAESTPEKRRFGFFKRGKLARKKGWETYDEKSKESPGEASGSPRPENCILFDIDAIRAELASEQMEVRQLESTLPPMKLDLNGTRASTEKISQDEFPVLRETKSFNGADLGLRPKPEGIHSEVIIPNGHITNPFENGEHEYTNVEDDLQNGREKVLMSFDTSHPLPSAVLAWQDQGLQTPTPTPSSRPELKSAVNMPLSVTSMDLDHNAWIDEEDDDFGKEQEVKLSFA